MTRDFDIDDFEERAAIMEFDGGMTRFEAETKAAERQGFKRYEVIHEISRGNPSTARNSGPAPERNAAHDMPRVQPASKEETRPLPERHVQA